DGRSVRLRPSLRERRRDGRVRQRDDEKPQTPSATRAAKQPPCAPAGAGTGAVLNPVWQAAQINPFHATSANTTKVSPPKSPSKRPSAGCWRSVHRAKRDRMKRTMLILVTVTLGICGRNYAAPSDHLTNMDRRTTAPAPPSPDMVAAETSLRQRLPGAVVRR